MKRIIRNISLLLLLAVFVLPADAQNIYKGQITVNPHELSQKGDSLIIHVDIDFTGLVMDEDRSLSLIPLLVSVEAEQELPSILINGRNRHKVYQRMMALDRKKEEADTELIYAVVKAEKDANTRITYYLSLPFEKWMENARLDLKEDLCGCAGHRQQIAIDKLIATVLMEKETNYEVRPLLSFIRPEVEEVKRRSEQRDAFLDFQVAKTVIVPTYMNNPRELQKIESMLNEVRDDRNLTVTGVAIKGYASPEGSVSLNKKLSHGRSEALRSYLASRATFPASAYNVEHGGEDWEGLEKLVENSHIAYKEDVLSVIRSEQPEDAREQSLKRIDNGRVYSVLLNEFYPQLRRVLCRVDYTVRGFNVEEAKSIIKERPQQLSLEEMFMVANTYDVKEPEFSDVFETAVRMFPEDEVANLNAAASALQWGDVERSKRYLDKASTSTGEYMNNLGVYYLLTGEYNKARNLFNRAIKKGIQNAEHNLKELDRKVEVEGL